MGETFQQHVVHEHYTEESHPGRYAWSMQGYLKVLIPEGEAEPVPQPRARSGRIARGYRVRNASALLAWHTVRSSVT